MAIALLGAVSCTPVGSPNFGGNSVGGGPNGATGAPARAATAGAPAGSVGSGTRATSGDLRKLRDQRAAAGGQRLQPRGGSENWNRGSGAVGSGDGEVADLNNLPPLPPISVDYRYAMPVPGRNGWVYNPFTNRPVDVRGVESGRLIYDERDPENRATDGTLKPVSQMPNKFRVP